MTKIAPHKILNSLSRWLSGRASEKEVETLRQASDYDPFLADAMEGLEEYGGDHSQRLTKLRGKLKARYQKKERKFGLVYLRRIAASLLLLIMGIAGIWYLNQPIFLEKSSSYNDQPSLSKSAKVIADSAPQDVREEKDQTKSVLTEEAQEVELAEPFDDQMKLENRPVRAAPKNKKQALPKPSKKEQKKLGQSVISETSTAILERVEEIKEAVALEDEQVYIEPSAPAQLAPQPEPIINATYSADATESLEIERIEEQAFPGSRAKAKTETGKTVSFIKGQVMDDAGESLIGANIREMGTNNGSTTNLEGKFELTLESVQHEVEISYLGYLSQRLKPQDSMHIILLDDGMELSDVIVVNHAADSSIKEDGGKPFIGEKAYKRYIKDNLRYPARAKENQIEGDVVVVFGIDANGRPENIDIKKELDPECDQEAIRLIEEGTNWTVPKQANETIEWTIRFKL